RKSPIAGSASPFETTARGRSRAQNLKSTAIENESGVARTERRRNFLSVHPGQEVSPMSRANITQSIPHQDDLELPDLLRVENRQPLTPEQRAHLDAVMAAARAPQQAREDLRALQLATKKEKSRIRIEKLLARKTGAAARMPLTGRAALLAITNLPIRAKPPQRGRPRTNGERARRGNVEP